MQRNPLHHATESVALCNGIRCTMQRNSLHYATESVALCNGFRCTMQRNPLHYATVALCNRIRCTIQRQTSLPISDPVVLCNGIRCNMQQIPLHYTTEYVALCNRNVVMYCSVQGVSDGFTQMVARLSRRSSIRQVPGSNPSNDIFVDME